MENFYDRVYSLKKHYKLNNNDLGAVISMTGNTFSKALSRMNLRGVEVEAINKYLDDLENRDKSGQVVEKENSIIDLSKPIKKGGAQQLDPVEAQKAVNLIVAYGDEMRKMFPILDLWLQNKELKAEVRAVTHVKAEVLRAELARGK